MPKWSKRGGKLRDVERKAKFIRTGGAWEGQKERGSGAILPERKLPILQKQSCLHHLCIRIGFMYKASWILLVAWSWNLLRRYTYFVVDANGITNVSMSTCVAEHCKPSNFLWIRRFLMFNTLIFYRKRCLLVFLFFFSFVCLINWIQWYFTFASFHSMRERVTRVL